MNAFDPTLQSCCQLASSTSGVALSLLRKLNCVGIVWVALLSSLGILLGPGSL